MCKCSAVLESNPTIFDELTDSNLLDNRKERICKFSKCSIEIIELFQYTFHFQQIAILNDYKIKLSFDL